MSYFNTISITKLCQLPISFLGNNVNETLTNYLKNNIEGKCSNEGFIEKNSIIIRDISTGLLKETFIEYTVTFECKSCYPVEGMIIECIVKNITKAGIRAEINETHSPMIIFLARDHHYSNAKFSKIKTEDIISVKIIGKRFELNDKYISVIAEHVIPRKARKRPKIIIKKNA